MLVQLLFSLDAAHLLHLLEDELAEVARMPCDPNASLGESLVLAFGCALATGNDGTGVTHPLARRSGGTSDEGDDWLLLSELVLGDPLGSVFFALATDFTDEDDTLGKRIFSEPLDDIGVELSCERITTDTDDGGLTKAGEGGCVGGLVCEGAGPADDTDLTGGVDVGWDDTELAVGAWLDDTWAVRADEFDALFLEDLLDLDHIVLWDVLSDADDETDTGVGGFDHGFGGGWSWDEDEGRVGAGCLHAISDGLEDWHSSDNLAGLLGVDTTDDLGAVLTHELGVELTLLTDTLDDYFGVFVDEEEWLVKRGSAGR